MVLTKISIKNIVLSIGVCMCSSLTAAVSKQIIVSDRLPTAIAPYSPAILITTKSGDQQLKISGMLPMLKSFELVEDPKEATILVMDYVKALLGVAAMDWTNVVDVIILVRDINDFKAISDAYGEYLVEEYARLKIEGKDALLPVRACFQAGKLPKGAVLEVKAEAIK